MAEMVCYVCQKANSKRCTRCYQIAYCDVKCQTKDWRYHKNSCKEKPNNIFDMLFRSGTVPDIFPRIFSYLSGPEIHKFCRINRQCRDITMQFGTWKRIKQWSTKYPKTIEVFKEDLDASRVAVHGNDIFIDVFREPVIKVYDVVDYSFKYCIRAADGNNSCWDVADDFLLVFDGEKFYIWDRHAQKEVEVPADAEMQVGSHCRREERKDPQDYDGRIVFSSKILKPEKDFPSVIRIFPETSGEYDTRESGIMIAYKSGIVSRWSYRTPYKDYYDMDEKVKSEAFSFTRENSNNFLVEVHESRCLLLYSNKLCFEHIQANGDRFWDKYAKMFYKNGNIVYNIETEFANDHALSATIEGVDDMLYYFESDNLFNGVAIEEDEINSEGYLLLTREREFVQNDVKQSRKLTKMLYKRGHIEGSYKEWLKSQLVQKSDENIEDLHYFEIHSSNSLTDLSLRRRMKIVGLMNACMNDHHVIISKGKGSFGYNYIDIYMSKEMIAEEDFCEENDVKYVADPQPIKTVDLGRGHIPMQIYLPGEVSPNVNQIYWVEEYDDVAYYGFDDFGHRDCTVKCINMLLE